MKGAALDLGPKSEIAATTSVSDSQRTKYHCAQTSARYLTFRQNIRACPPLVISCAPLWNDWKLTNVHRVEIPRSRYVTSVNAGPDLVGQIHRPHVIGELSIVFSAEEKDGGRMWRWQGRNGDGRSLLSAKIFSCTSPPRFNLVSWPRYFEIHPRDTRIGITGTMRDSP